MEEVASIPPLEDTPIPEPPDVPAEMQSKIDEAIAEMDAEWSSRTPPGFAGDDVNATRSMCSYEGVNAEALPQQQMIELSVCHGGAPAYRKFAAGRAYSYDDEGNVEFLE